MKKRAIIFKGRSGDNKNKPVSEISKFAKIETEAKKQPKPLYLVMQKKWFVEIESGRKIEEYRDLSEYYTPRFCNTKDDKIQSIKNFRTVILQEGYHAGARRMIIEVEGISLGNWFTIHLGSILDRQNF